VSRRSGSEIGITATSHNCLRLLLDEVGWRRRARKLGVNLQLSKIQKTSDGEDVDSITCNDKQ